LDPEYELKKEVAHQQRWKKLQSKKYKRIKE
jgi:hypothetical protein